MTNTMKIVILVLMMVNLSKTMDDLMKEMNERLAMTEAQLDMTKDDLKAYKEMTHDLQKQVLILRNPPWTFACGSHYDGIMATSMAISYSKLLYSSSNVEGAGLDISSGVFNAVYPGT